VGIREAVGQVGKGIPCRCVSVMSALHSHSVAVRKRSIITNDDSGKGRNVMGMHNHWRGSGPAHCKECAKKIQRSSRMSIPTTATTVVSPAGMNDEIPGQLLFPELEAMQKVVEDRVQRLTRQSPALAVTHEQRMQQLHQIKGDQPALVKTILEELKDGPEAAGWTQHPSGTLWYSPETESGYRSASWAYDRETQQSYVTSISVTFNDPEDDDDHYASVWMDVNENGVLHNDKRTSAMQGNSSVDGGSEWYIEGELICRTVKEDGTTRIVGPNGKRLPLLTEMKLTWVLGFNFEQ